MRRSPGKSRFRHAPEADSPSRSYELKERCQGGAGNFQFEQHPFLSASATSAAPPRSHRHAGERVCDLRGTAEVARVRGRARLRPPRCRRGRTCTGTGESATATAAAPPRSYRHAGECACDLRGAAEVAQVGRRARLRPPRRRRGRTCTDTGEIASATSAAPPRSHRHAGERVCNLRGAAEVAQVRGRGCLTP